MKSKEFNKCIVSIINGQSDMEKVLMKIKRLGTEEQYEKAIMAIQKNVQYRKALSSLYKNRNINDIFTAAFIPSFACSSGNSKNEIYRDVLFMVKFLLSYEKVIGDFYYKKAQFESSYLSGNFQAAAHLLEEIYDSTGISYWYIEMKLLLLNYSDYETYRNYYESLKNLTANDLIKKHIRLIKRRVNMRTSQNEYCEFFNNNFAHDRSDWEYNCYRAYVDFMYTESPAKLSEMQLSNLTTMIHHLTLVDTTLFVERFLLHMIYVQGQQEYMPLYNEFKSNLNVRDVQRSCDYHALKLLFCDRKYIDCKLKCEELLAINSDRFEVIDIYVKALLVSNSPMNLKKCPLSDIVNVLINCYLKKDGSAYGSSFMDKSNQILRTLSSFNGYYEFLNIISNTMYVKSTMAHPYWNIMVRKRPFDNAECDVLDGNIPSTGILSCDWSYSFYEKTATIPDIICDEFSARLKDIRDAKKTIVSVSQVSTDLDRVFLEEEVVIAFQENVERMQYLQAVQIYVQVLVEDILLATRCDVKQLSDNLTEEKCVPMLSNLSFYVFAATTDLNRHFKDAPSQILFDSLHDILLKYEFNVPSDFINCTFENQKLLFKFLELCCDETVLTQSPCDLYGKENLKEQLKILEFLYQSTHHSRYRAMLDRVKAELAEFNVRNIAKNTQLPNAKINTDWLSIEYDSDVASAYDQLCELSYEEISEDDDLFNIYKAMFYRCKEKYLTQVNKQLGTFIRHGVFINTLVEFLNKHDFFFPTGDKQEDEERIKNSLFLQAIPIKDRITVFRVLQKNCLDFFKRIETVVGTIFFTSEKHSQKYTPIYIESKELKTRIRGFGAINNDIEFIETTKKLLDKYIEEKLPSMRKRIEADLHNAVNQYFSALRYDILAQYYTLLPFDALMNDFSEVITYIGEWFQIINNTTQKCSIDAYLKERDIKHPDISFTYPPSAASIRLCDLFLLDIIIENLIRNVESHSGYSSNHKDAQTEIRVNVDQENNYVEITASNRLNGVDEETLQTAINKINTTIHSPNPDNNNLDESLNTLQIHGVGLYNLKCMLYKTCKDSHIFAKRDGDTFFIKADFSCGGCD